MGAFEIPSSELVLYFSRITRSGGAKKRVDPARILDQLAQAEAEERAALRSLGEDAR